MSKRKHDYTEVATGWGLPMVKTGQAVRHSITNAVGTIARPCGPWLYIKYPGVRRLVWTHPRDLEYDL